MPVLPWRPAAPGPAGAASERTRRLRVGRQAAVTRALILARPTVTVTVTVSDVASDPGQKSDSESDWKTVTGGRCRDSLTPEMLDRSSQREWQCQLENSSTSLIFSFH